jgi:hypothetical protein
MQRSLPCSPQAQREASSEGLMTKSKKNLFIFEKNPRFQKSYP